jgi:hypothetical protein
MPRRLLLPATIVLLLVACGRDDPADPEPLPATPAPAASAASAPAPGPTPAVAVPEPPAPTEAELPGECRALIDSYERCIENHMPEAGRDLLREALARSREQWQQAAADATTEATRRQLAQACQQGKAALQAQMSGYGCIL